MQTGQRLKDAFEGNNITSPVYSVYDAFLTVNKVDWTKLCHRGLGVIQHVITIESNFPNLEVEETIEENDKQIKRDVYWKTSRGTLHEYYLQDKDNPLLPWRMEYLIESEKDYEIMLYALRDAEFSLGKEKKLFPFPEKVNIQDDSIYKMISLDRTPFQVIQIDYAGLERFSFDIASSNRKLLDLIKLMNEQLYQKISIISKKSTILDIKLWENLSIEVMGPQIFREYLLPVYRRINRILRESDKRLHVHYDGKMKMIVDDIAQTGIFGLDSFTSEPEGDLSVKEARNKWSDKFLWIHPSISLYDKGVDSVLQFIQQSIKNSGNRLFTFLISEDVPSSVAAGLPEVLKYVNSL